MTGGGSVPRRTLRGYLVSGILYLAMSLPVLGLLVTRGLDPRYAHLLGLLTGAPLGILLILAGSGRLATGSRSWISLRIGIIGLAFGFFGAGFLVAVGLGVEPLLTAFRFCAVASSYLALVALVFLIAGAASGRK